MILLNTEYGLKFENKYSQYETHEFSIEALLIILIFDINISNCWDCEIWTVVACGLNNK